MDMMMTGGAGCHPFSAGGAHCPGMTDDQYRTEFALWSITQSPLIVATDLTNMTGIMKKTLLNKEMLDWHQSTATPPGKYLAQWLCSEPLHCQVWGRRLNEEGTDWLVALVNTGSKPHGIKVEWGNIGWKSGVSAQVRDLWTHQDLPGLTSKEFGSEVPAGGTQVVRIVAQQQLQIHAADDAVRIMHYL